MSTRQEETLPELRSWLANQPSSFCELSLSNLSKTSRILILSTFQSNAAASVVFEGEGRLCCLSQATVGRFCPFRCRCLLLKFNLSLFNFLAIYRNTPSFAPLPSEVNDKNWQPGELSPRCCGTTSGASAATTSAKYSSTSSSSSSSSSAQHQVG